MPTDRGFLYENIITNASSRLEGASSAVNTVFNESLRSRDVVPDAIGKMGPDGKKEVLEDFDDALDALNEKLISTLGFVGISVDPLPEIEFPPEASLDKKMEAAHKTILELIEYARGGLGKIMKFLDGIPDAGIVNAAEDIDPDLSELYDLVETTFLAINKASMFLLEDYRSRVLEFNFNKLGLKLRLEDDLTSAISDILDQPGAKNPEDNHVAVKFGPVNRQDWHSFATKLGIGVRPEENTIFLLIKSKEEMNAFLSCLKEDIAKGRKEPLKFIVGSRLCMTEVTSAERVERLFS
jgi:hypothetical protein